MIFVRAGVACHSLCAMGGNARRTGRAALAVLTLAALGESVRAQAPEPAFVELVASDAEPFVGEVVRLTCRFGFRDGVGEGLEPLFRRPLELPVQLVVPELTGVAEPEALGVLGPRDGPRCALGEEVVHVSRAAPRSVGGARFDVYELQRSVRFLQPGRFVSRQPSLRFRAVLRTEQDVLGQSTVVESQERTVRGDALELEVRQLPPGAPPSFSGWVGSLDVEVVDQPRSIQRDEPFAVVVNLLGIEDPGLAVPVFVGGGVGVRELGTLTTSIDGGVEWRVDSVAQGGTAMLPIWELTTFSPDTQAYVTVRFGGERYDVPFGDEHVEERPDRKWVRNALSLLAGVIGLVSFIGLRRNRRRRIEQDEIGASP